MMVVMASATVARELTKLAAACLRARQRCGTVRHCIADDDGNARY